MQSRNVYWLALTVMLAVALMLSCSGPKNNATDPGTPEVTMTGSVTLPYYGELGYDDLTVGFGDHETSVGEDGTFAIDGHEHVPGLAMIRDGNGIPVLMAIVPDPSSQTDFTVDVRTTAVALTFLHPFVCTNDSDHATDVLNTLNGLDETTDLEYLIENQFAYTNLALAVEDADLIDALTDVVMAYVNSYPEQMPLGLGKQALRAPSNPGNDGVQINPDWEVSGLQLSYKGGDKFEISNRFGRWAYCTTPSGSFLIYPNGDFLDLIKDGKPWQPSKRTFTMPVTPNSDTAFVKVYGYGFAPWDDTKWDDLTPQEQQYVHTGGVATVTIELAAQMISVITNSAKLYGRDEIADKIGETVIGMILSDGVVYGQISIYVRDGDGWGLSWFLAKHILNEVANNPSFRSAFASATGLALTDGALSKLASWVALPIKATLIYNSVTSVLKTVMALSTAELKTTFAVWEDVVDFGGVHGQVADASTALPISGATVVLTGDEGNPLNPNHQMVTASDGHYYFYNIGVGSKTITASKSGYSNASVSVTIAKDQDIEQHIVMSHSGSGDGVSGRVLNGVLVHHGINPATFQQDVQMAAYPLDIVAQTYYGTVQNGTYAVSLSPGTWRIRASYDGYFSDSLDVTVPASGSAVAPRDLVLQPHPTMEGNIYIDMNNDGSYEKDYHIVFESVGLNAPAAEECPAGGSGTLAMAVAALEGSTTSDIDFVQLGFALASITGPGVYAFGPSDNFGCPSAGIPASVGFITGEEWCHNTDGGNGYMSFTLHGDPQFAPCDCGMTEPGNLYLTDWGTALGELVTGGITVDLPGWTNCSCSEDQDGWHVDCAKAHLNLDFKIPVGTGYLTDFSPEPF